MDSALQTISRQVDRGYVPPFTFDPLPIAKGISHQPASLQMPPIAPTARLVEVLQRCALVLGIRGVAAALRWICEAVWLTSRKRRQANDDG